MFDGARGFVFDWSESSEAKWWNDKDFRPWGDEEKRQWREKRISEKKRIADGYENASKKAIKMLSECTLGTHAYLRSKQLPNATGLIYSDGSMLIPMRDIDTDKVIGVQSIFLNENQDGFQKKFIFGMKAKRAVFRIGIGRKIILVEGYATGLSVYEAAKQMNLNVCVICCFSSNNIIHVAKTHGHFVMADNDKSMTGEKSAIQTGLPFSMPDSVGMDWNDVHATRGLMAVCVALSKLVRKVA
ncbi:hypothetical protein [Nitrosomonas sp. PY1]|uniref:hypothetical protein n=1 Tax=Nitrosomonas sp. PY1 TaxID=1803906 RepID=UPI001FC82A44|nr:hypothetical protein [Nitrosomonas sp. PY1]